MCSVFILYAILYAILICIIVGIKKKYVDSKMDRNGLGGNEIRFNKLNQRITDKYRYNSPPLFNPNIQNPFLVSPYSIPTNYATQQQLEQASTIINSTIISIVENANANISSFYNPVNNSIQISTIKPGINDTTNTVSLIGGNLNIEQSNSVLISTPSNTIIGNTLNIQQNTSILISTPSIQIQGGNLNVVSNATFTTLTATSLTATTLNATTLTGTNIYTTVIFDSTNIRPTRSGYVLASGPNGNTLWTSTLSLSSFNTDSISTGNIQIANGGISTIAFSSINSSDTRGTTIINGSNIYSYNISSNKFTGANIYTTDIYDSTGNRPPGSGYVLTSLSNGNTNWSNDLSIQSIIFSSLTMIPSTFSTTSFTGPAYTSSILINLNGSFWKIPVEPA